MPLHVQRQVVGAREGTVAQVALEGPVARVLAVVARELVRSRELPAAAFPVAVVGLLACVDDLVLGEVLALGEPLATLVTNVGTLPRVCPPMTDQQGRVGKAASTVWARVRLFQILGTLVPLQGWVIGKGTTTVRADGTS